jgi:2-succinyl-5-enolpyruvyl-6-hydroxy-3-cyclohexene-1-carboxylate synthase
LLGDVSFAHDIGSLALARDVERPVVVVVVDNGGGRIFGELPIAARGELRDDFSRFFTTPPKLDLVAIARAFGADATDVSTRGAFVETLSQALRRPRLSVLVATVDAPDPSPRRALATRIREAVEASS